MMAEKEMRNMLLETREKQTCYIVAGNLAELYATVVWKAGLLRKHIGYLADKISKQNVENMAWFLLAAYNKK